MQSPSWKCGLVVRMLVDIANIYYSETTTKPHTDGFRNAHYGWNHLCKTDPEVGGSGGDKGTCADYCRDG